MLFSKGEYFSCHLRDSEKEMPLAQNRDPACDNTGIPAFWSTRTRFIMTILFRL